MIWGTAEQAGQRGTSCVPPGGRHPAAVKHCPANVIKTETAIACPVGGGNVSALQSAARLLSPPPHHRCISSLFVRQGNPSRMGLPQPLRLDIADPAPSLGQSLRVRISNRRTESEAPERGRRPCRAMDGERAADRTPRQAKLKDGPEAAVAMPSSLAPDSPGCTCCICCAAWASPRGCSKRATASAAPGSGTAIPAHAATWRAWSIPTRSPRLQKEWQWTERYPAQPEILRYVNHVADRFDLRRDIQLETRVTAAHYDDAYGRWQVRTDRGEVLRCPLLRDGNGMPLHGPRLPEFKGRERFKGRSYHTGHWPKEGIDFTGQRVGVIGTGSSAIQVVPMVAKQAKHLHVFQRTPNFSIPAHNRPLTPRGSRRAPRHPAEHNQKARDRCSACPGTSTANGPRVPEEDRRRQYEAA